MKIKIFLIALLAMFIQTGIAKTIDKLYEGFVNPPAEARPSVYWWWNGNCLNKKEIVRELDSLKDAGIGGVIIFPMAMTMGADKTAHKELEWLSPEWGRMLQFTIKEAKKRDIFVDLLVGTGWPYGGPFVKPGHQIQMVQIGKTDVKGPAIFKKNVKDLMVLPSGVWGEKTNGLEPKLMFLRYAPKDLKEFQPATDLMNNIKPDGTVEFEVPPGEHTIFSGTLREGFIVVNIPAPGGQGPVLDHYNRPAADAYFKHFTDKLKPFLGSKIGKELRSLHCDSFEFTGANWTNDVLQEFEKRRGYSIEPYLHYLLEWPGIQGDFPIVATVNRARYDFWKTNAELFEERFLVPFHNWCRENGTPSRVEAYGCPAIDQLNPKLTGDYQMGEVWIIAKKSLPITDTYVPIEEPVDGNSLCLWHLMDNKYASSGAHLRGKKVVSCETMTNAVAAFRVTFENIKHACDLTFIDGINHHTYHGFNYNPPEAGFPGWFYCGEYFDTKNTWWPYMKHVNNYIARICWVLQQSDWQANVAIIDSDPCHPAWKAAHSSGYTTDYVSERILNSATFENGKIHYGPMTYDVLVLNKPWCFDVDSAKSLARFAKAGGKIIFIASVPNQIPGLKNSDTENKVVQEIMDSIIKDNPKNVVVSKASADENLITRINKLLSGLEIYPAVEISAPNRLLSQIHKTIVDRDIFFFVNLDYSKSVSFDAKFQTGDKTPWLWNPETGKRSVYPFADKKNLLQIELAPLESLLLVFEPELTAKPQALAAYKNSFTIESPWQVNFKPAYGEPFRRTLIKLIDFKDDPNLIAFAGTAVYMTDFEISDVNKSTMLDLGIVRDISEVSVNGKQIGVQWWGKHRYDINSAIKPGRNKLEIKVTTVLSNYCRSLKDNPVTKIWLSAGLAGVDIARQPLSEGLVGPVQILTE